jgi:hypothetical protein
VEEHADIVGKCCFPKVTEHLLTPLEHPSQGSEPNAPAGLRRLIPLRYLGVEESSEGLSNNLTFLPLMVAAATIRLFPYENSDMAGGIGSSFRHGA